MFTVTYSCSLQVFQSVHPHLRGPDLLLSLGLLSSPRVFRNQELLGLIVVLIVPPASKRFSPEALLVSVWRSHVSKPLKQCCAFCSRKSARAQGLGKGKNTSLSQILLAAEWRNCKTILYPRSRLDHAPGVNQWLNDKILYTQYTRHP